MERSKCADLKYHSGQILCHQALHFQRAITIYIVFNEKEGYGFWTNRDGLFHLNIAFTY